MPLNCDGDVFALYFVKLKADESISQFLFLMLTHDRDVQLANANEPTDSTFSGIFILLREVHDINVPNPIYLMLLDNLTYFKLVHDENAEPPISVTLSGILTRSRLVQPVNSPKPILLSVSGNSTDFILFEF